MKYFYLSSISIAMVLTLAGCASKPTNPTGDLVASGELSFSVGGRYQVKAGDTVSKIAKEFNMDWRALSAFNHLDSKHTIYAGQWLDIPAVYTDIKTPTPPVVSPPVALIEKPVPAQVVSSPATPSLNLGLMAGATIPKPSTPEVPPSAPAIPSQPMPPQPPKTQTAQFVYPVGQDNVVVKGFGVPIPNGKTEGIFFVGNVGDGIVASDAGTIVYANAQPTASNRPMVVIDHNNGYVSTYFDVGAIVVKVGDSVQRGDRLGGMTPQTKSGKALFEFRIAHNGRYIDPMTVIQ